MSKKIAKCYNKKVACNDQETADTRTHAQVVLVRHAVLESTRRRLGLLHAQNVRLASLPTVRLLFSVRTVMRMRIPKLGARGASAYRGTRETAPHAPLVIQGRTRLPQEQMPVSFAQLTPIQRLRRPFIAMIAGSILTPPPAAPPAFATQASPETAHPVLRVRQASIKSLREMQHASTVRPGNTQQRRRPWAVTVRAVYGDLGWMID